MAIPDKVSYFATMVVGLVVSWIVCLATYVWLGSTPWARRRELLSVLLDGQGCS